MADIKPQQHFAEDEKAVGDLKHSETGFDFPTNNWVDQGARAALAEGESTWKVLLANPRALAVILAVQSNAIMVGIEFSLPGNLLGVPAFLKEFGEYVPGATSDATSYAVSANVLAIWSALFATFQIIGQFTGGYVSDRFGRKMSFWNVIFWTYIGVMLEVIATTWQMWLGSKIVIGFATGMMQSVVPTYVAEVAPRELRGIMLSFFNMAMNIGGLVGTILPWATNKAFGSDINDLRAFRVPLYVALAAPTITLVAELFLLVESPYWLMMKGRKDQAMRSITFLNPRMSEDELSTHFAMLEYTLEKESVESALTKDASYLECFKGIDLRRTFCAVFPPITQNLTGQNLVGTYATYFFALAKQKDPLISSVITTVVGLAANFASFFVIESKRVGRWALLFGGLITMTASMLAIALIATITKDVYNYAAGVCLVLFVALFSAASTLGPGVAGWAYTGESGSARLRAKTTTLGTMGNALIGLVMTTCLPYLLTKVGAKTGFMFFGLGLISCVAVFLFVPDFTGKSFAQIDECFYRRIPARKFASTVCTGDYGRDLDREVAPTAA